MDSLRNALARDNFQQALNIYYRGVRSSSLLSWAVYIDQAGTPHQALLPTLNCEGNIRW